MRQAIIFILFILLAPMAHAQEVAISPETKEMCNQVMLNIYSEILQNKEKYKELANFGERALFKNSHDIYAVIYQYGEDNPQEQDPRKKPYAFAITIDRIGENNFPKAENPFNYSFPPLGLKFSGHQNKHLFRSQYDILPMLKKQGEILTNYQQKFLPLRLYLKTEKDTYKIRDNIGFEVTLVNVSKRNMLVDALSEDTLYFIVDNEYWGITGPKDARTEKKLLRAEQKALRNEEKAKRKGRPGPQATKKGLKLILRPGDTLSMKFKGESFLVPRDVEIYAAYRMKVQDTQPSAQAKIKVVADQ